MLYDKNWSKLSVRSLLSNWGFMLYKHIKVVNSSIFSMVLRQGKRHYVVFYWKKLIMRESYYIGRNFVSLAQLIGEPISLGLYTVSVKRKDLD